MLESFVRSLLDGFADARSVRVGWFDAELDGLSLKPHGINPHLAEAPVCLEGGHIGKIHLCLEDGHIMLTIDRVFAVLSLRSEADNDVSGAQLSTDSQHSEASRSSKPEAESPSSPPAAPGGFLAKVGEWFAFALLRRIRIRVSNVHLRVAGAGDVVASVLLRQISIGDTVSGSHGCASSLCIAIAGLALSLYRATAPERDATGAISAAPREWDDEAWAVEMMPLIEARTAPEHLLMPVSIMLHAQVWLGEVALQCYRVDLEAVVQGAVSVQVEPAKVIALSELLDALNAAGDDTPPRSPSASEVAPTQLARIGSDQPQLVLRDASSFEQDVNQQESDHTSSADGHAQQRTKLVFGTLSVSDLEVALIGRAGPALTLGIASWALGVTLYVDELASEERHLDLVLDGELGVAVGTGSSSPDSPRKPRAAFAQRMPPGGEGSMPPALLHCAVSQVAVAITMRPSGMFLKLLVGGARLECAVPITSPPVANEHEQRPSGGAVGPFASLDVAKAEVEDDMTGSTAPIRWRRLTILETFGSDDCHLARLAELEVCLVDQVASQVAEDPAIMPVDLKLGRVAVRVSADTIFHAIGHAHKLASAVIQCLPSSGSSTPSPPCTNAAQDAASGMLVRLRAPQLSLRLHEIDHSVRYDEETGTLDGEPSGGYAPHETVCCGEVRDLQIKLTLGAGSMKLKLSIEDLQLAEPSFVAPKCSPKSNIDARAPSAAASAHTPAASRSEPAASPRSTPGASTSKRRAPRHGNVLLWRLSRIEVDPLLQPDMVRSSSIVSAATISDSMVSAGSALDGKGDPMIVIGMRATEPTSAAELENNPGQMKITVQPVGILLRPDSIADLILTTMRSLSYLGAQLERLNEAMAALAPPPVQEFESLTKMDLKLHGALLILPTSPPPVGEWWPGAGFLFVRGVHLVSTVAHEFTVPKPGQSSSSVAHTVSNTTARSAAGAVPTEDSLNAACCPSTNPANVQQADPASPSPRSPLDLPAVPEEHTIGAAEPVRHSTQQKSRVTFADGPNHRHVRGGTVPSLRPSPARQYRLVEHLQIDLERVELLVSSTWTDAIGSDWVHRGNLRSLSPEGLELHVHIRTVHNCAASMRTPGVPSAEETQISVSLLPMAVNLRVSGLPLVQELNKSLDWILTAFEKCQEFSAEPPHVKALPGTMNLILLVEFAESRASMRGADAFSRTSGMRLAVHNGALPLAEILLNELYVRASLSLLQPERADGQVAQPLVCGEANARLGLQCSWFNEGIGKWEPVLEPCIISLTWACGSAFGEDPSASIAASSVESSSPSTDVVAHSLHLQSPKPIELNVSHAMLSSALQVMMAMARAERDSRGRFVCTLSNQTELPIVFEVVTDEPDQPPTPQGIERLARSGSASESALDDGTDDAQIFEAAPYTDCSFASQEDVVLDEHADISADAALINSHELVEAARKGHLPRVEILLARAAPVDSIDSNGRTALHYAIMRRDAPVVRALIRAKADCNKPAEQHGGIRPLHLAARRNTLRITKRLLDAKADALATNFGGQVPAAVARPGSAVQIRIYRRMQDAIRDMSGSGGHFSSVRLVKAANAADRKLISEILNQKADPNSSNGRVTALQACVESPARETAAVEAIGILLASGAHIDMVLPGQGMRTALTMAAQLGRAHLIKALLHARADPCTVDEDSMLPLDLCTPRLKTKGQRIDISSCIPTNRTAFTPVGEEGIALSQPTRVRHEVDYAASQDTLRQALLDKAINSGWVQVSSILTRTASSPKPDAELPRPDADAPSAEHAAVPPAHQTSSLLEFEKRFTLLLPTGWLMAYADEQLTRPRERVSLSTILTIGLSTRRPLTLELNRIGDFLEVHVGNAERLATWRRGLDLAARLDGRYKGRAGSGSRVPEQNAIQRAVQRGSIGLGRAARAIVQRVTPRRGSLRRDSLPSEVKSVTRQRADKLESATLCLRLGRGVETRNEASTSSSSASPFSPLLYEPIERVEMQLGRTLFMLQPAASAAHRSGIGALRTNKPAQMGLVANVNAVRGVRTITVSSPVSVMNQTGTDIEVRLKTANMPQTTTKEDSTSRAFLSRLKSKRNQMRELNEAQAPSGSPASSQPQVSTLTSDDFLSISKGKMTGLPLQMSSQCGSTQAVFNALELRPSAALRSSLLSSGLPSNDSDSKQPKVLRCEPVITKGEAWHCCVEVLEPSISLSSSWQVAEHAARTTESVPGDTAPDDCKGRFQPTQWLLKVLESRPGLPSAHSLLHGWPCTVRERGASVALPGWLGVSTTACVVVAASSDIACDAEQWYRVTLPSSDKPTGMGWLGRRQSLTGGKSMSRTSFMIALGESHYTISGLLSLEETLGILQRLHSSFLRAWNEGPGRWLPRTIVLHAPLSLTNRLPCAITITLRQETNGRSRDKFSSMLEMMPSLSRQLSKAGSDPSLTAESGVVEIELDAGQTSVSTALHALQPLRASLCIAGHRHFDEPWKGDVLLEHSALDEQIKMRRRAGSSEQVKEASTQLQVELTQQDSSGRVSTAHTLRLRLLVSVGASGQLGVTFEAPHAFQNLSSLPLRLHPANVVSFSAPFAVQIEPREGSVEVPFSLGGGTKAQLSTWTVTRRMQLKQTRTTLNLLLKKRKDKGARAAASLIANAWRCKSGAGKASGRMQLSKPFSIVEVGTESVVQVTSQNGRVHDICIRIGGLMGTLTAASTTLVTASDALLLRNASEIEMQWRTDGEAQPLPALNDKDVPLFWSALTSGAAAQTISVRARMRPAVMASASEAGSDRMPEWTEWCAPFDARNGESCELKLRAPPLLIPFRCRFKLVVSVQRAVRRLVIESVAPGAPQPFRIENDSDYLLAYRQLGTKSEWELLGAREARGYMWDEPSGARQLEVAVRDATDYFYASADSPPLVRATAYRSKLMLSPRGGISPSLTGALSGASDVMLSASCTIKYGDSPASEAAGWLCISTSHLSFLVMRHAGHSPAVQAADTPAEPTDSEANDNTKASTGARWASLGEMPLRLSQLTAVEYVSPSVSQPASRPLSPILAQHPEVPPDDSPSLSRDVTAEPPIAPLVRLTLVPNAFGRDDDSDGSEAADTQLRLELYNLQNPDVVAEKLVDLRGMQQTKRPAPMLRKTQLVHVGSDATQPAGTVGGFSVRSFSSGVQSQESGVWSLPGLMRRGADGPLGGGRPRLYMGVSTKGPLRVLLMSQSLPGRDRVTNADADTDAASQRVTEASAGAENVASEADTGSSTPLVSCVVNLSSVGLSIIDQDPAELLYLSLQNLQVKYRLDSGDSPDVLEHSIDLSLQHIQIDSAINDTQFKVLLAPLGAGSEYLKKLKRKSRLKALLKPRRKARSVDRVSERDANDRLTKRSQRLTERPELSERGWSSDSVGTSYEAGSNSQSHEDTTAGRAADGRNDAVTPPCLAISVERLRKWAHLLCASKVVAQLDPLVISLEQNTLARLLRLVYSLVPLLDELADTYEKAGRAQARDGVLLTTDDAEEKEMQEIFLEELSLSSISLNLTLQLDPVCVPVELQAFHPAHHSSVSAASLASMQGWQMLLPMLEISEAFETSDTLVNRVLWHYSAPLLRASYRLLGSLDVLGNPAALVADWKDGMRQIISAPAEGIARGDPRIIAAGLAKGTAALIGGSLAYVLDFSAGVNHMLEQSAVGFSRDLQQRYAVDAGRQDRCRTAKDGLMAGTGLAGNGVLQGVRGLVYEPVKGLRQRGAVGFVEGGVNGVVGLVVHPVAGLAGATAKATEGLASDVRRHTPGGRKRDVGRQMLRIRQPRDFSSDAVLRPYPNVSSGTDDDGWNEDDISEMSNMRTG